MIKMCAYCKEKIGEKEPYEDKSETHGICGICYPFVMQEVRTGIVPQALLDRMLKE